MMRTSLLGFIFGAMFLVSEVYSSLPPSVSSSQHDIRVYREAELDQLFEDVALRVIDVIGKNPEAVILLPTGTTPEKLYAELIKRFKNDTTINFSKAYFINLDEYVGLEPDHPLSYGHYMKVHFYDPLKKIDPSRAPREGHILLPPASSAKDDIERFKETFKNILEAAPTQSVSLAILGVGGAYPEEDESGNVTLKGGHIAFNEPGTTAEDGIRCVNLTEKTRRDTRHRFAALRRLIRDETLHEPDESSFTCEVPYQAVTLGVKQIREADEIIVMALSEDKAPVIKNVFSGGDPELFPATHLVSLSQVSWYLDSCAASGITVRPWTNISEGEVCPRDWVWEAMCDPALHEKSQPLQFKNMAKADLKKGLTPEQFSLHHKRFHHALVDGMNPDKLPEGKRILIVSPHPDDDVISMGATMMRLQQRANNVYVLYGVSGANAVSTSSSDYVLSLQELRQYHGVESDTPELVFQAKSRVREQEALRATGRLGIPSENLMFFKGDYYNRRGVPGLSPFSENDLLRMSSLLEEIQPDYIYFAAENDPNGAHGLTTQLIAKTLDFLKKNKRIGNVTFYGYRGAYNEWPLYEVKNLTLVPFDKKTLERKILSIKDHVSQLDPLYPSFDPRPFYQRASHRNRDSLNMFTSILGEDILDPFSREKAVAMEAFYQLSSEVFIRRYKD